MELEELEHAAQLVLEEDRVDQLAHQVHNTLALDSDDSEEESSEGEDSSDSAEYSDDSESEGEKLSDAGKCDKAATDLDKADDVSLFGEPRDLKYDQT